MPDPDDPGGVGDLHVVGFDGRHFDFPGGGHRRYLEFRTADVRILGRLVEVPGDPEGSGRTYREGLDLLVGDRFEVYITCNGRVNLWIDGQWQFSVAIKCDTIDAPGHPGSTSDDPHPLQGVPHINLTVPNRPAELPADVGGFIVDGDREGATPADYLVDG